MLFLGILTVVFSQEKTINKFSVAPNPYTQQTNITFKANTKSILIFRVKNVYKKYVYTKIDTNSILFSKNDLVAEMDVYRIQNKNKIVSKRFVI